MPKGIPLTDDDLSCRRREILEAIAQLLVEKGFQELSMREISQAAGIGKSTLYDYFPSKDDILIALVADEVDLLTAQAKEIIAQDLTAAEKISRILHNQLMYMFAQKLLYLKVSFEIQRLSYESQQRIQQHRHAYQDMLCRLIEEGIQNGEFREVNPLLAVRGMFAFLSTAVYTSRPTGSLDKMMSDSLDIIFNGLQA